MLVVDCAPTGETLRLLAFPDVARWWIDEVLPKQGRLLESARPLAKALLDVTLPGEEVLVDVGRLAESLVEIHALLHDTTRVSVRLVMTPERMVIDEARRTFTYLNLYGFLTDAVVVNRVFPAEVGPYFGAWRDRQEEQLRAVRDAFAPVPVLRAPYFDEEVTGAAMLDRLGDALFAADEPAALLHHAVTESPRRRRAGRDAAARPAVRRQGRRRAASRRPGARRPRRRPSAHAAAAACARRLRPTGAALEDGALTVRFARART